MLLLAALLAASSQLTLSSRRTTADQQASLRAQYVAESGVALAQSRLRDVQVLLSPTRETGTGSAEQMRVPYTTTAQILKTQAEAFCNKVGNADAWEPTDEFVQVPTDDPEEFRSYPQATICSVASGTNAAQLALLAQYVLPTAFDVLPAGERPSNVNDYASRLQWWNNLFNQEQVTGGAKYTLRPLRAVQLSPVKYRFYVQLASLRVRGDDSRATRVLAANRTADSQWWFEIELPSLLDDVLMTNHHRARPSSGYDPIGAPGVNFDDQVFDGSIHTNEKLLFTSSSSARFNGKVSSVGCIDLPQNGPSSSGNCTAQPGVHIGSTAPTTPPAAATTTEQRDTWLANKVAESPRTVQFVKDDNDPTKIDYKKTDFTAEYKPLPANENDQKAAARDGGLELGNALGVELAVGGTNGAALTSYNAAAGKWNEPDPVYQYIRFLKAGTRSVQECSWTDDAEWADQWNTSTRRWDSRPEWTATITQKRGRATHTEGSRTGSGYWRYVQNCQSVAEKIIDSANEYRVDKDGNLFKKNGSTWVSQGRKFNGVIYGEKFDSLRGPERRGSDQDDGSLGNVPPAVASFVGITIASTDDIRIDTDLTVSDTPCTFASLSATPPCTKKPQNILGIYSQSGDISFSQKTRRDLNIHAAMIASTGQVTADNFSNRLHQGNVNLIGSLIENWYGAFGLVGDRAGYGRNFTYDQRLKEGTVPPFFPVSPRWKVEAAAQTDKNKGLGNVVLRQAPASEF